MDPSLTPSPGTDQAPRTGSTADRGVDPAEPTGSFVMLDGEEYYGISHYHRLRPFLMTLASDSDLWMFITTGGGLTAGRRDPDGALFPYETVDRLHDAHHHTGPLTLVRVEVPGEPAALWEPFSDRTGDDPQIERRLYKNRVGNRLVFEELHREIGLRFRYRWSGSDAFGLVRTATLENLGDRRVKIGLLDGLRNVLPYGAPLALYQQSSCLVDAYKRADCDAATRLGIYSLTSKITDRAEAAEELRANTVWCHGLGEVEICLSLDAVAAFRRGTPPTAETILTGRRGNYFVSSSFALEPGTRAKWHIAADVGRSHVQIAAMRARLLEGGDLDGEIEAGLAAATENLIRIVGSADGLQRTGHAEAAAHHFANVLFNTMRGGIFAKNYAADVSDLLDFLRTRNLEVARRHEARLTALPTEISLPELISAVESWGDPNILRLCYEYLPIYFGRRHGDPSRPWNRFSIHVKNPDGSRALHYEGNWRDIFQNWEALCLSFPGFLPSIIAKFVNASTADGFNPYRITRDGVDWEVPDPGTPWGHIGYWGDHQIVYLLRLLEALPRYFPGVLEALLTREIFCHADVPYRLRAYERILDDPRESIDFDAALASRIEERVAAIGTDGRLLPRADGTVHHVNLLEKLLIPALSKLSNFVPGGGIWMNTQRPEWNDANNALAGNGLSMVTLFYLRRYLEFVERLVAAPGKGPVTVSAEVTTWLRRLHAILLEHPPGFGAETGHDRDRKTVLDALGSAFSHYREGLYARGFSGANEAVPAHELAAFCRCALDHMDRTIRGSRRADGLYHSYNILEITRDRQRAVVLPLEEMLEGQVAALGSGVVGAEEAVRIISGLFESRLYRPDQRSFVLYPEKELPAFLDRNRVPDDKALAVPLLGELLDAGETSILERDALGVCRFQGDLRHATDLSLALDRLAADERWRGSAARDRQAVLDLFEGVFRHHAFTGRSGAMYAYEGLGSIYWHMVAKLLLAVQEVAVRASREGRPPSVRAALEQGYFRIRAGLGFEKSVWEYGAFPTDPYSHTPSHAGAQQPGMTGQVKELILTRAGELGVVIEDGRIAFEPTLLRSAEFLSGDGVFRFHDLGGRPGRIQLAAGSLAFTVCQVPVVYRRTRGASRVRVSHRNGTTSTISGNRLDATMSRELFTRGGAITSIEVDLPDAPIDRGRGAGATSSQAASAAGIAPAPGRSVPGG